MDDISIDRMVLNVPDLTPSQGQELAKRVGDGLAAGSPRCGHFPTLVVELNEQAMCGDVPRLANAIVSSLLGQLG